MMPRATLIDSTVVSLLQQLIDMASGSASLGSVSGESALAAVSDLRKQLPKEFALQQNYPNPFNPTTTIRYELPVDAHVQLKIFDILGREVTTLVDGDIQAGYQEVQFDAGRLASGVYLYQMEARSLDAAKPGIFTSVKKMILVK